MHSQLLLLLLLIVEKIGERTVFSGICWKLRNGVDGELDLEQ
jgi:hypothetical protein